MGKSADSVRVIKSCRELAQDYAPKRSAKNAHIKARKVEHSYARKLKMVARAIGDIVVGLYNEDEPFKTDEIINHLNRYAKLLEPWAKSVGARMVAEVNARDKSAWAETSKKMAGLIRREVSETEIGQIFQARLAEQVHLITSLPLDAAERVHKLTIEGMSQARRAEDIASEIMRSGHVSRARAVLISRTEVSRTHVEFQRARAESIGSKTFVWRTSQDSDVRESHRKLNGKTFEWNNPPECDPGHHALPGGIWNCFPGDTIIGLGNGIKRIIRAQFTGQVVKVVGVVSFTATTNHPVLTNRGWIAAGEIRKGDYLVKPVNDTQFVVDANVNNMKPTFEQLFETFAFAKIPAPAGIELNFYGDVANGDVDHITFDRPLTDNIIANIFKTGGNLNLSDTNSRVIVPVIGIGNHVVETHHSSGCDEIAALAISHFTHAQNVSLATPTDINAVGNKHSPDNATGDAIVHGQSQFALTTSISCNNFGVRDVFAVGGGPTPALDNEASGSQFDTQNVGIASECDGGIFESGTGLYQFCRVDDLIVSDFSGHVYTLETVNGWYGVSQASAIVKNCRCWAEPLIEGWD